MALTRRTPLRRKSRMPRPRGHRDPVTPALRLEVLERDERRCIAPRIAVEHEQPIDECKGLWGRPAVLFWTANGPIYDIASLTLDHVNLQPTLGKRAPSDLAHLVSICWHHHLDGWSETHRPELRDHLRRLYPDALSVPSAS